MSSVMYHIGVSRKLTPSSWNRLFSINHMITYVNGDGFATPMGEGRDATSDLGSGMSADCLEVVFRGGRWPMGDGFFIIISAK